MNVLIPGSFDPITLGHVNIIERAADLFDKVYVAVMNNDSSKYDSSLSSKTYMFDMQKRLELIKLSIAHIENAEAVSFSGMLIDLCDKLDTHTILKGVRTSQDFGYEMIHAKWNREHNCRVETLFLPCDGRFASVSSTSVREFIKNNDFVSLSACMTPDAVDFLKNLTK